MNYTNTLRTEWRIESFELKKEVWCIPVTMAWHLLYRSVSPVSVSAQICRRYGVLPLSHHVSLIHSLSHYSLSLIYSFSLPLCFSYSLSLSLSHVSLIHSLSHYVSLIHPPLPPTSSTQCVLLLLLSTCVVWREGISLSTSPPAFRPILMIIWPCEKCMYIVVAAQQVHCWHQVTGYCIKHEAQRCYQHASMHQHLDFLSERNRSTL